MNETNSINMLFENKVRENPDALSVYDTDRRLSRVELQRLADTITAMIPRGTKRVGIVMDHSVEMIAAILAVLKTGAAYIPVEPFFPDDRIGFMMRDSDARVIITNSKYVSKISAINVKDTIEDTDINVKAMGNDKNDTDIQTIIVDKGLSASDSTASMSATAEDLAYILYTSGSTGNPKGVSVTNSNVCHYVRAFADEFHPDEKDTMLQYSVCSFDIFVEEVFATILNGAVLAIPSDDDKENIESLMSYVSENHVTEISGFPYLLMEMNHLETIPDSIRLLISGGDVIRESYVNNLVDKVSVYNTYGPSETTVCASYYNCSEGYALPDGTYPVGKPVSGMDIRVVDENMNKMPDGETGELIIIGYGVSAGYIGDRKIENMAFVKQEDGTVIYRSGDMGYILPDGNIAFLHRKDTQVMIMGKRVETIEVESILMKCPEIKMGVVQAYTDEQNLSYLVAYIVTNEDNASLSTIKKEMARFLPTYMIPEFFIRMKDLPMNANGKVDLKVLPIIMKEGLVA
ncbi:MAG: amino acid adenylation domain-containing protein [Lachnospiraceae bacterium]|jgi:amino acid adenylation domain-containing protein|nr:amino acid adenylation domain-containing protein [Lachnospiraceae bacterium]